MFLGQRFCVVAFRVKTKLSDHDPGGPGQAGIYFPAGVFLFPARCRHLKLFRALAKLQKTQLAAKEAKEDAEGAIVFSKYRGVYEVAAAIKWGLLRVLLWALGGILIGL